MENDRFVTEVMLGNVCLICQSVKEFGLSFDQRILDRISYQLEHFNSNGKTFNYQTLLLLMVITENLGELREIEPINFLEDVDLSQRNATISFFTFASSIIPAIYKVIFGSYMPKISENLKVLL